MRFKALVFLILLSALALTYNNCSRPSQGTELGNPIIDVSVNALPVLKSDGNSSSVRDIVICLTRILVTDAAGSSADLNFSPRLVTLNNNGTDIGVFEIPAGRYQKIELHASSSCGELPLSFRNSSGEISLAEDISLSFSGDLDISGKTRFLNLDLLALVNGLDPVTNSVQAKTALLAAQNYFTVDGFNSTVEVAFVDSSNKTWIAGWFTEKSGEKVGRIVRLNPDDSIDSTFNPGGAGADLAILDMIPDGNGGAYIGGDFMSYNGTTSRFMTRLRSDGTKDPTFNPGQYGAHGEVGTIIRLIGGDLLLGGHLDDYNETTTGNVVRINANGELNSAFTAAAKIDGNVLTLAQSADGKIYVGGSLQTYNGNPITGHVIRLNSDGTLDNTFSIGTGFNSYVTDLKIAPDGDLYVGGAFISFNGVTRREIARLNPDGSLDTGFDPQSGGYGIYGGPVQSILLDNLSGGIYLAGYFVSFNDVPAVHMLKLLPSGQRDTSADFTTGFNAPVLRLNPGMPDYFFASGPFTAFKGTSASKLFRYAF